MLTADFEVKDVPLAQSPEQNGIYLGQQIRGAIPAFVLAAVCQDPRDTRLWHEAMAAAYGWEWKIPKQMIHSVGQVPREEFIARKVDPVPHHKMELSWHGDALGSKSTPVQILHQTVLGSTRFEAVRVIADDSQVFTNDYSHTYAFMDAAVALINNREIDTTFFEPVLWQADLEEGQAISFTSDGPGWLLHRFEDPRDDGHPVVTPRISIAYDFVPRLKQPA